MEQTTTTEGDNRLETRWARIVSDVLSPPVIWAVVAVPIAFRDGAMFKGDATRGQILAWVAIYDLLFCVLPVAYIAYGVWRGTITDLHVKVRRQRIRPFLVTIICGIIALGLLIVAGAPRLMPMFALFSVIQIVLMLVITFFWQISIHAMGITGAVVATAALYGVVPGLLVVPLIPLVGAARVALRRHTIEQVIAGGIIGGLLTALCFAIV